MPYGRRSSSSFQDRSMDSFEYEPIDLEGHSFRLLRLFQGCFGNVRCEIIHAYLDDESLMEYEALSYTWGGNSKTHDIVMGGSIMPVTQNLSLALQSLRKPHEDRILWIDAICINQNNIKERGHQVLQMASIYAKAEQVLIWLGPATPETDLVLDIMSQFEKEASKYACRDWRISDERWQGIVSSAHLSDDNGKMTLTPDQKNGLKNLVNRPWFERVWIIQEVANARAARVTCGTKSVLARTFALFPHLFKIECSEHCQAMLDIMPGPTRKHSWWAQRHDLSTLILKFRGSYASDPRDKVYALLGISSDRDSEGFPVPDYEKTENEVAQCVIGFLTQVHTGTIGPRCLRAWTLAKLMQHPVHVADEACVEAAERGSIATIKGLLDTRKANPNYKTMKGQTPLLLAVKNGHHNVVRLLVESGKVDVNLGGPLDWNPLLHAVRFSHYEMVKLLIERGKADVNFQNQYGQNPLLCAVTNGDDEMARLLIERGKANVDFQNQYGQTPLLRAVTDGDDEMAGLLIERGKANMNVKNQRGQIPLLTAARAGREVALKCMLGTGAADLDVIDDSGWNPLCTAAIWGHEAVVHMLLRAKDADASTPAQRTAVAHEKTLALELLEIHKTGCNIGNEKWLSPLSWALQHGRLELFELLMKVDLGLFCLSKISGEGVETLIESASQIGLKKVVTVLLRAVKTDLTFEDYWAKEALDRAVRDGDCATITLLKTSGRADVLFKNGSNWFALAEKCGHTAVVEELFRLGLRPRTPRLFH